MSEHLPGLPLCEAEEMLAKMGAEYRVTRYNSNKPYEDADSERVVRAVKSAAGVYELVVCGFKTKLMDASQD